jgi:hypothetical protein
MELEAPSLSGQTNLNTIAEILVQSYLETSSWSLQFRELHGPPPTKMTKAHYFLSCVQASILGDERYELQPEYAESGRTAYLDQSGAQYLLRSNAAVGIEADKRQPSLFKTTIVSPVKLLVHKFHAEGLDLSVTGTKTIGDSKRLHPTGIPSHVGTWSYDFAGSPTFSQGEVEAFEELGEIDESGEGGAV